MRFTQRTKEILDYRRTVKRWKAEGYEEIAENGSPLWEIHRGLRRYDHVIKDARIAPGGKSVFVKIEPQ